MASRTDIKTVTVAITIWSLTQIFHDIASTTSSSYSSSIGIQLKMFLSIILCLGSLLAMAPPLALATSFGVHLGNFRRRDCGTGGGAEFCYNFAPLPACCSLRSRQYFVSGNCVGCTPTDIHYLFGPGRYGLCGVARTGSNNGQCINAQNAKGHGWCRVCHSKARRMIEEGASAEQMEDPENGLSSAVSGNNNCMPPNLLSKSGDRFFKVNHDVPKNITDMIYRWYDDDSDDGPPPNEILQYEVDNPFDEAQVCLPL